MLIDFFQYGLLKITGVDTKKLLQGQLTCDVEKIQPNQCCVSAHCNSQGRMISLFHLLRKDEDYYLLLPRTMVEIAFNALKKYSPFYKTQLNDVSKSISCVGYKGNFKSQYKCFTVSLPESHHFILGEKNFIEEITTELKQDPLLQKNTDWHYLTIHQGIPTIYPETSGKFLPHEINLHTINDAISFDKGCYTGQEIIARMHYRGKLKKRLHHAFINTAIEPKPGANIYFQQNHTKQIGGTIVDSHEESHHHYHVLFIADDVIAQKTTLYLEPDAQTYLQIQNQSGNNNVCE